MIPTESEYEDDDEPEISGGITRPFAKADSEVSTARCELVHASN